MDIPEILGGESRYIEYKSTRPEKSKIYIKTVVSFCNGVGGKLVFGIEDKTHKVIGIREEILFKEMDAIANAISDLCEPMIVPDIYMQTIEDKTVIVANIAEGVQKPYYIKSEGIDLGTYIRIAGTTRPADEYMIQELRLEGARRSFDEMPCVGLEITEEDIKKLCKQMKEVALANTLNEEDKKKIKDVSIEQLISWKIIGERNGKYYPNNAYAILTGDYHIPNMIQCAVFKGSTKAVFVDHKEYMGKAWELVEEAYNYVLRNIRIRTTFRGVYRLDIYEIPTFAIRELIVNAVVHRSYVDRGNIQIAIYDDRLEILSPGKLPKTQTFESMKKGRSKIRNEALAKAFFYMKLMEKWGSGIPRVMKEVCDEGLDSPVFEGGEVDFIVNIYRKEILADINTIETDETEAATNETNDSKALINSVNNATNVIKVATDSTKTGTKTMADTNEFTTDERSVIDVVRDNPTITQQGLLEITGISMGTIKRIMPRLQKKGVLIREGNRRVGQWKVVE